MSEQQPKPRYFRLLEEGEKLIEGDLYRNNLGDMLEPWIKGHAYDYINNGTGIYLRPIIHDEWIEYAKQKPTKEDSVSGRGVQILTGDGLFASHHYPDHMPSDVRFWRRVTSPQPAKPKSVKVELAQKDGGMPRTIIVNADGTASLPCGEAFTTESINKFIEARDEVMKK